MVLLWLICGEFYRSPFYSHIVLFHRVRGMVMCVKNGDDASDFLYAVLFFFTSSGVCSLPAMAPLRITSFRPQLPHIPGNGSVRCS